MLNPLVFAIPVFLILILIEFLASKKTKVKGYELKDTISNLSCGIYDQLMAILLKTIIFGSYIWTYQNFAFFSLKESSVWTWIIGFLAVDFMYYWWHRISHEVNFFWAGHIVHHSSEKYNLSVALRQAPLTQPLGWIFYIPVAILGVPPTIFITSKLLNLLYQFWLHTELISRLGFLESFLNTPSHHRVHHGKDQKYLDKNYGGTFIIWDKIFGSFQKEEERPSYGITHPLNSFSAITPHTHYWKDLYQASIQSGKINLWWKGPMDLEFYYKNNPHTTPHLKTKKQHKKNTLQVVTLFLLSLIFFSILLFFENSLTPITNTLAILFIGFSLWITGRILDPS